MVSIKGKYPLDMKRVLAFDVNQDPTPPFKKIPFIAQPHPVLDGRLVSFMSSIHYLITDRLFLRLRKG